MEIKQQLRLSQQLVMTPQLQQAIKLLQMSRTELVDMVREEMLENPILEDNAELSEVRATEAKEGAEAHGDAEVLRGNAELHGDAGDNEVNLQTDPTTPQNGKNDIDWERYLENHSLQAPVPSYGGRSDFDELPTAESNYSVDTDLSEHLLWQLRMTQLLEEEQRFANLVIGNLDDDGYLKMEGVAPEDVVAKLALEAEIDVEGAEEVLKLVQRFDPVGVATRTLAECLRIQAQHREMDDLILKVIDCHLPDLEKRAYPVIAKSLQLPLEEIYDIAQAIMELDPRPARNFAGEPPQYITPDVHVLRVGERYFVVANDDGMPKLKISGFYRSAMTNDPKAKEYIQSKLRSAQWLIRSIDQRRKTIVKVTECIVEKQIDFFEKGIDYLKPMILRDVAETVGMHESTISRVTSNKYVHTPRGLFELKFFFNSGIRRDNLADIASESVKQAIKQIIEKEDNKDPLSDQQLVEILAQDNIVIARRTVAKYREALGVLSSSKRKKYF